MSHCRISSVPLGSLLEMPPQNGYSPTCSDAPTGKWVLGLAALDGEGLDLAGAKPAPLDDTLVDRFLLRPGDFLISRSNTLDKVGRIGVFHGGLDNCSFPDLMMRFRPDPKKISPEYLEAFLRSEGVTKFIQQHATGTSGSMKKINQRVVESIPVLLPPPAQQLESASLLGTWYHAIEKVERLIVAKERLISHLREHHLQQAKGAQRTKIHTVTRESTERNGDRLGRDRIMAVTKQAGMIPMREQTIAANIDRYKVVRPEAFAYNPMRLNIGSIAMSPFDHDILVSPDYVVFECDESQLLPSYLNHLRHSRHWISYFGASGSGSVRVRIYYDDLGAFTFELPPIREQARIIRALDAAALELETLTRYCAALKTQKRGLMQKLLTGQWRLPIATEDAK